MTFRHGATAHTGFQTREILKEIFLGQFMSKFGDVDWPPRSPELTTPRLFPVGLLEGQGLL